jgi:hypothetical protein
MNNEFCNTDDGFLGCCAEKYFGCMTANFVITEETFTSDLCSRGTRFEYRYQLPLLISLGFSCRFHKFILQ